MPKAKIVDTAQNRPGGDFLTGDNRGPFLDTGLKVGRGKARYGNHIYLSLKHLAPVLHEAGWLSDKAAEKLRKNNKDLSRRVKELESYQDRYEELSEVLGKHVEPEVVEVEVVKEVPRKPTEDELTSHVRRNRRDLLGRGERTSDERWREVYRGKGYQPGEEQRARAAEETTRTEAIKSNAREHGGGEEQATFTLEGQQISLDDVLSNGVKEVLDFAEGHGDELAEALMVREYELAETKGGPHPRKGVIEGLGYEFEEDDN